MQAFPHADQAETGSRAIGLNGMKVEANAVVFDGATEDPVATANANPDATRASVANGIGERFLDDTIKSNFDGSGKTAGSLDFQVDGKTGAFGDAIGEKANGGNPAQIVEDERTQLVRVAAQLAMNLIEGGVDLSELFLLRLRKVPGKLGKREMNSDEQLPGFIVDGMGDTLDFFFESFIQAAKGQHRVLKSKVGHFVGREEFRQECASGLQDLFAARGSANRAKQCAQGVVMQRSDFGQASAGCNGATSEVVSAAQGRFPAPAEVLAKSRGIFAGETSWRFPDGLCGGFQEAIPAKRTTKTRASSTPVRKCSRIRPAAR
jgi:hypothetical protein